MRWKTSPLKNLTDARYFNALENAVLSFSFDALQADAINLEECKKLFEWLFEPTAVAAFGLHQDEAEISYILNETGIQMVEVPWGHELLADAGRLPQLIVSISPEALPVYLHEQPGVAAVVVNLAEVVPDESMAELLRQAQQSTEVFLRLAPDSSRVREWLHLVPGASVELSLLEEIRPGWSYVDEYDHVIEDVEAAF